MRSIKLLLIALLLISSTTFAQKMDKSEIVLKNILERKSVRTYTEQRVEKEDLEKLLRAAMAAPTAVNAQPWAFIAIDDREILDNLADLLPYAKMLKQAQAAIIVCGNMEKALEGEGQEYWIQDCSAATQNILLAAESLGLGAVWTGVYPKKERIEVVQNEVSLPKHIIPLCVIPIGWQTGKEKPKQKYNEENIHWNKWKE
ncbi:MAG: nitroreductase family protein [Bacteroidales bacterium]|nr:nitroreductase family protein [Bacteroidales bacterium]